MTGSSQALRQLDQIESFCDLCDRLPMPPVTLPADAVRAAGLDPDIWHGLGIVSLWATIDAFAERTQPKKVSGRLVDRLSPDLPSKLDQISPYAEPCTGVRVRKVEKAERSALR